jgi:GYF domain 2
MARERWFFAQGHQRRGPTPFNQLVESLRGQPDPRAVLVWRKGFADWTRAEDVPEVERRLAPILARKAAEEAAKRAPAPPPVAAPPPPARVVDEAKPGSPALVYGGIAAGVAVLVLLGWLFWPRPQPPAPPSAPVPLGGTTAENAPAVVIPAPPTTTAAASPTPAPATPPPTRPTATPPPASTGLADRESEIPKADLRKLRGVAAWAGDSLKLTVYNGTTYRVTELYVRVGRFVNDDFIEDPRPILLTPPGGQVDAGVADLLSRVAPDRKKPGLNPADTGPFAGKAGQQPENFRWEIESARGYAPK